MSSTDLSETSRTLTFRNVLPDLKGRTITGYATGAAGDHLLMLTLTLDDGSWVELKASAYDSWIDVERHSDTKS